MASWSLRHDPAVMGGEQRVGSGFRSALAVNGPFSQCLVGSMAGQIVGGAAHTGNECRIGAGGRIV